MKVFITGANSAIAKEVIEIWASQNAELYLTSKDKNALEKYATDLSIRIGREVYWHVLDVKEPKEMEAVFNLAIEELGEISHVFMAHGFLGNPNSDFSSLEKLHHSLDINFRSCVNMALLASQYFKKLGRGHIIAIGSVAGDRGRASNFVYGSGKGAVHLFFQGLRGYLNEFKIAVTLIKPGLVATPMTGRKPGLLVAKPKKAAKKMVKAIAKQKEVIYVPWFWRWIMFVICSIPEKIFKRLSI